MRVKRLIAGLPLILGLAGCPWPPTPPSGPGFDEAAERQAILSRLEASDLKPFFPTRLINDGIGIFALSPDAAVSGLPRRWGRSYSRSVQASNGTSSYTLSLTASTATGQYRSTSSGLLVMDFPWSRRLLSKRFQEQLTRSFRLEKLGTEWTMVGLEPAIVTAGSNAGIKSVKAIASGSVVLELDASSSVVPEAIPTLEAAQIVSIEARVPRSDLLVYAQAPPKSDRISLVAGSDGIFRGTVSVPAQPGVQHLVIEAMTADTFTQVSSDKYDVTQWGIPYRVRGGEAQ